LKKSSNHHKSIHEEDPASSWKITYNRFKPDQEGLREALCALGNGYFGTRGAELESGVSTNHYPGTYIAGVYNKLGTHIAGRTVFNEDFVNCPNWLWITFKIGAGEWISSSTCKILSYHQELNMQGGVLYRRIKYKDRRGRVTMIESTVIVHMSDPHCAAIKYVLTPLNYHDIITVKSGLDGSVQNTGVTRYRQLNSKHLKPCTMGTFDRTSIYMEMRTSQSEVHVIEAARVRILSKGREVKLIKKNLIKERRRIFQEFDITVHKKQPYEIEKIVSIFTSKDSGIKNEISSAVESVKTSPAFDTLLKTHQDAWKKIWDKFDIKIQGDDFSQRILRLHTFHLLQISSSAECFNP